MGNSVGCLDFLENRKRKRCVAHSWWTSSNRLRNGFAKMKWKIMDTWKCWKIPRSNLWIRMQSQKILMYHQSQKILMYQIFKRDTPVSDFQKKRILLHREIHKLGSMPDFNRRIQHHHVKPKGNQSAIKNLTKSNECKSKRSWSQS